MRWSFSSCSSCSCGVEFLAAADFENQDVVIEEQTLELLHDVALDVARSVGVDAVRLVDELARGVEVARHELLARLDVEIAEVFEDVVVIDLACRLLHLEDGLELAETVEAELLCEAHDGRRGDGAVARELVDGDVAHVRAMRDDILPDDHVRGVEVGFVLVDDFIQLHDNQSSFK